MDRNTKIAWGIFGGIVVTAGLYEFFKPLPDLSTPSLQNAHQLGMDLGTAYSFYDPRRWSENDSAAEDLINSIPVSQIPQLEADYKKLFNRTLSVDLQKYLSGWNNVSYKFAPSGITKSIGKIKIKRFKK